MLEERFESCEAGILGFGREIQAFVFKIGLAARFMVDNEDGNSKSQFFYIKEITHPLKNSASFLKIYQNANSQPSITVLNFNHTTSTLLQYLSLVM